MRPGVINFDYQVLVLGAGFPFFKIPGPGPETCCSYSKYRGQGRARYDLIFTGAAPGFIEKIIN